MCVCVILCVCVCRYTGKTVEITLIPSIKKKKGKKKEVAVAPALERIMGYAGSDMSEEEVRVTYTHTFTQSVRPPRPRSATPSG